MTARSVTIVILSLVILGLFVGLCSSLRDVGRFQNLQIPFSMAIFHVQWSTALFALLPMAAFFVRLRKEGMSFLSVINTYFPIRMAAYVFILVVVTTSIAHGCKLFGDSRFLTRSFFNSSLLVFSSIWVLIVIGLPQTFQHSPKGFLKLIDIILFNLLILVLLLEGALSLWANHSSSPLFWDESSIQSTIDKYRRKPYSRYFNFISNSGGYHDTEFFITEDEDFVVALLADSFGVGVVPYEYHFATVAERCLQESLGKKYNRVAVHNFGITCIGMPEYVYLLKTEVLQLNPTLVVLCVFIGNDIEGVWRPHMGKYCFQNWWIWILPKRFMVLKEQVKKGGKVQEIGNLGKMDDFIPAYIHDDSLELPSFTEEKFREVERNRLEICRFSNRSTRKTFDNFFLALEGFRSMLGNRLLLVLIPDEFQVNDSLYQNLLASKNHPEEYDRDYPQRKIEFFCRKSGIPVLDLLEPLRKSEQSGRNYHFQDTHWNARGNKIGGKSICNFILEHFFSDDEVSSLSLD